MTSKAERKRKARESRERFISLAGGESVPQRPKQGRRRDLEDARAITETAANARVRRSGIPDPLKALQPIYGTDMGLCIDALTQGDERRDLANAWQAISASHRNYRLFYIGMTGNPKGASIGMVPDKVETDTSLRVDLRTPEEKVRAAKASWSAWEAKIKALPVPQMTWALRGAIMGFMGEERLWRDCQPTATGRVAVDALRRVAGA